MWLSRSSNVKKKISKKIVKNNNNNNYLSLLKIFEYFGVRPMENIYFQLFIVNKFE